VELMPLLRRYLLPLLQARAGQRPERPATKKPSQPRTAVALMNKGGTARQPFEGY
jgi:hypothetical protein